MPLFERDDAEYTSEAHAQALTGTPVENAFVEGVYEKLSGVYDLTFGPLLHPGRLFAKDQLGIQPETGCSRWALARASTWPCIRRTAI
jgi:hypothetical protein